MDFDERLQPRDLQVLKFINDTKVTDRNQIKKAFFKNVHYNICMRRLKFLVEGSYVNRTRYKNMGNGDGYNGYIYFPVGIKKPSKKILTHNLMVSDFYATMLEAQIEVLSFQPTYMIGNIIADAYIKYRGNDGVIRRAFLEVQRSSKISDCVLKYKDIKSVIMKEKNWNTMPRLIVMTDLKDEKITLRNINVTYITSNLKNIRGVLF